MLLNCHPSLWLVGRGRWRAWQRRGRGGAPSSFGWSVMGFILLRVSHKPLYPLQNSHLGGSSNFQLQKTVLNADVLRTNTQQDWTIMWLMADGRSNHVILPSPNVCLCVACMWWGQFSGLETTVKLTLLNRREQLIKQSTWRFVAAIGEFSSCEGEAGETDGCVLGTLLFYGIFCMQQIWPHVRSRYSMH